MNPIVFGATIGSPTGLTSTTTLVAAANNWNYAYTVTGVKYLSDTTAPGTNNVLWTAVPGAVSYNVYKATPTFNTAIAAGAPFGFIGNTIATSFQDPTPGISPDFQQGIPVPENPFLGSGVASYTVTVNGTYTSVPSVTVAPPALGAQATASASLGVTVAVIASHDGGNNDMRLVAGSPNPTNSLLTFSHGAALQITSVTFNASTGGFDYYRVNSITIYNPGSITSGTTPTNPQQPLGCTASGFNAFSILFTFTLTWGVTQVVPISQGAGYTSAPAVTFSAGAAAATAVLGPASAGNPGVPGFLQERLVLASQPQASQSFNFSQPSSFF